MNRRNRIALVGLMLVASLCGAKGLPDKVKYDAPAETTLMKDGTSLKFKLTHAEADEMKVRITITNMSSQLMMLDRDGIMVKLPDGKMLKRLGMKHDPFIIQPGKAEDVSVNYPDKGRDMRT